MKWDKFRQSDRVEDYRDPNKPLKKEDELPAAPRTLQEYADDYNSPLAKDAGKDDIGKNK